MKPLCVLALIAVSSGCSFTSGTKTGPDGSKLSISNKRFIWSSEGISFATTNSDGTSVSLGVIKSNPDAELLKAVAEGVAKGMVAGAKP